MDGPHLFLRKNKRESLHDLGMVRILRFNITSTIHKRKKNSKMDIIKSKSLYLCTNSCKDKWCCFLTPEFYYSAVKEMHC